MAQVVENQPVNAGTTGSIPGSGRSPGEENGNTLQYSYLGNPMDRAAWWAAVHGVTKESDMTQRLKQQQRPRLRLTHSSDTVHFSFS